MTRLMFIILALTILIFPVSAGVINITPVDTGYNFIRWTWDPAVNATNVSIDGISVTTPDLAAGTYILSGVGPGELHQINIYSSVDAGSNLTRTENTGDVPVGLWVYAFFGVVFLGLARWSMVRFINLICPIFGLLGIYQLLGLKDIMDASIWMMCLVVYMILLIAGGAAFFYGGRK
jgi:hypothetical protein